MATITVRNLDESVVTNLKRQADANGRSLEAEVRRILAQAAKPTLAESRERLQRFLDKHYGDRVLSSSAPLIREDRDR